MKKTKMEKAVELNHKRSMSKKQLANEIKAHRTDFVGCRATRFVPTEYKTKSKSRIKNQLRKFTYDV